MKKGLLLLMILFFVSTIVSFSQSNYNDYPDSLKKSIIYEDFNNNSNKWTSGNLSDNSVDNKIKDGYLEIKVPDKNKMGLQCMPVLGFNPYKNWEIETRIKYTAGSTLRAFALFWGYQDTNSQGYFFFIDAHGLFKVQKKDTPGINFINYKDWAPANFVNKSDWNKLTVRKVNDKYYFFINDHYISSAPFESFYGDKIGYYCGGGLTIRANYLKVSYLESQNNMADNSAPEIIIYNPVVSRGVKISEANKQLLVKGKATGSNGIYEVAVNGIDANVNANGEFQQTVKLAFGENTVTVKATDTKNNTANYSFDVNRQSEMASIDTVLNENSISTNEK
jgi:hypothetical protein